MNSINDRVQQLKQIREEFRRKKEEAKENAKTAKRQISGQMAQLAKMRIASQRA